MNSQQDRDRLFAKYHHYKGVPRRVWEIGKLIDKLKRPLIVGQDISHAEADEYCYFLRINSTRTTDYVDGVHEFGA
jgi:hypothetical protein